MLSQTTSVFQLMRKMYQEDQHSQLMRRFLTNPHFPASNSVNMSLLETVGYSGFINWHKVQHRKTIFFRFPQKKKRTLRVSLASYVPGTCLPVHWAVPPKKWVFLFEAIFHLGVVASKNNASSAPQNMPQSLFGKSSNKESLPEPTWVFLSSKKAPAIHYL